MEKINIYRKRLSQEKEIELKQDLIVPDSKQDIFQILNGNFYCYFSKTEISSGRIRVNGNVDSYISYTSSSEQTSCLQTTFNFEDSLENNSITDKMNLEYQIEVAKQDIKVINERKISISITLKVVYELYGTDSIEIFNDFSKIEDVQVNSQQLNINSLVGVSSGLASLKEEIKIDSTDIVADILKISTDILNKEVKISYNKVLAKADLIVNITYLTQDERTCEVEEKFPIMSFIDIENVKEENICSNDYQVRNILLNANNSEENSITIQMEYEIICKAFENKNQDIVTDLYSLKYDVEFTSKEIEISDDKSENGMRTINVVQDITKKEISNRNEYSMIVYSVKKNDTLWDISKKFRVKQENIINSNQLEEPYALKTGEKMYIIR